jgi:hypothetical protein
LAPICAQSGASPPPSARRRKGELHCGEDVGVATVATATDELTKVVVVQPEYSAVTIAAQMVPESSLLIFEDVRETSPQH